jgi:hypothetical protein
LLLIGPATTVPPGVVNVSVIEVKPSACLFASGTTKCQPSSPSARSSNGPSHSCLSNSAAVVGTWLGLIVAANTPAARDTVPRIASAMGSPNRLTWAGILIDDKIGLRVIYKS